MKRPITSLEFPDVERQQIVKSNVIRLLTDIEEKVQYCELRLFSTDC